MSRASPYRFAALTAAVALMASAALARAPADTVDLAAEVREAKVREAALRSVAGSLAALQDDLADPEELAKTMLAEPATFADPESARARLAGAERAALREAFREQLEAFARGRDEALPEAWVDEVLREESERVDATIDAIVGDSFVERYRTARAAAVERQRNAVAGELYPPAEALLQIAGDPVAFAKAPNGRPAELAASAAAAQLASAAVARVRSETPLFAEIDATLDRRAVEAVAAGLAELWRQLGAVERFVPAGAVREADIAAGLRTDLETMARAADLPYGVFPEAAERVAPRAAELERRRLADHVGDRLSPPNGCPALPRDAVEAAVGEDVTKLPQTLAEHLAELREQLRPRALDDVVATHAAVVDESQRTEFAAHVRGLLQQDETLVRRFTGVLDACIEPPLRAERERLAAAALERAAPQIADLSFELADDDLATLSISEAELDPSLFPQVGEFHLEETRAAFATRAAALQREARAAVRLQELLTRAPDRRRRFVRDVESDTNRTAERKQHYQKEYEAEVLEAWKERRGKILLRSEAGETLHPNKYGRIFPTTAEIIDEIITIEFERPAPQPTIVPTRPSPLPTLPPTPVTPRPTPQIERSGPRPEPREAGLPARSERPLPLPQTGGAPKVGPGAGTGGPKSCEEKLQTCRRATSLCYEALVACRDRRDTCEQGIAACGQAKFASEQAK